MTAQGLAKPLKRATTTPPTSLPLLPYRELPFGVAADLELTTPMP